MTQRAVLVRIPPDVAREALVVEDRGSEMDVRLMRHKSLQRNYGLWAPRPVTVRREEVLTKSYPLDTVSEE